MFQYLRTVRPRDPQLNITHEVDVVLTLPAFAAVRKAVEGMSTFPTWNQAGEWSHAWGGVSRGHAVALPRLLVFSEKTGAAHSKT